MQPSQIEKIRERVRQKQYDITACAMEEMSENNLDITDIENAMLHGRILCTEKDNPNGNKDEIEGVCLDEKTPIGVVGRMTETGRYLIMGIYKSLQREEEA